MEDDGGKRANEIKIKMYQKKKAGKSRMKANTISMCKLPRPENRSQKNLKNWRRRLWKKFWAGDWAMINKKMTQRQTIRLCGYILGAMRLIIHLMSLNAFAGNANFRPTYDKIMILINFFILAFVIIKYGKKPSTNFLQGRTDEVAKEIHRLQKQKNAIDAKISKTNQMIEDSSTKFEQIKARIIDEA